MLKKSGNNSKKLESKFSKQNKINFSPRPNSKNRARNNAKNIQVNEQRSVYKSIPSTVHSKRGLPPMYPKKKDGLKLNSNDKFKPLLNEQIKGNSENLIKNYSKWKGYMNDQPLNMKLRSVSRENLKEINFSKHLNNNSTKLLELRNLDEASHSKEDLELYDMLAFPSKMINNKDINTSSSLEEKNDDLKKIEELAIINLGARIELIKANKQLLDFNLVYLIRNF